MDWVSGIVVYILLWWWVLFMALPFGLRSTEQPDAQSGGPSEHDSQRGQQHGAPTRPRLLIKVVITSIIALILWVVVNEVISSEVFSFRDSVRQ